MAAVLYRGRPAGVPHLDDLAEIRALGFTGVTWPLLNAEGAAELRRLADIIGLAVVIRDTPSPPAPVRRADAPVPISRYLDLELAKVPTGEITARVWRAIAHGARVISFDGGAAEGAGLSDRDGRPPDWLAPASAIARQLSFNGRLVRNFRPAPAPVTDNAPAGLDVVFLDGDRAWVLIATNLSAEPAHAMVRGFPPKMPAALWVDLLDATMMSMLSEPSGPRWNLTLGPWGTRVYVVDKTPKISSS